ncbi:hypothetical protein [Streptomyces halstedii]|uniref:hypothetical protein n=1 Tax=Streptomyces halstedii TaxID=1944 RepID=UPI0038126357
MNTPTKTSPLIKLAALLSFGSLIWTTWSLFDLLGAGPAGVTVAVCADAVWGSVIYAEYRGVRLAGKRWPVALFGWAALLAVASFLVWHGIADNNLAMAYAGPFLPLGAKVVWALALADMRDPAALTDDELHTLAAMERDMAFEEAQHRIEMRRREMGAELQLAEVSVDFDIELTRQDKTRELMRRRPLELTTGAASDDAQRINEAPHPRRINDAPAAFTAAQTQNTMLAAAANRTAAASEAPAQQDDAPLKPAAPAPSAARRITDEAPRLDGLSKAAAVRVMRDADPAASAPQIVQRLAHHGIEADASYVRTVLSRINRQRDTTNGGYL